MQAARMCVPADTFVAALVKKRGKFKDWGFLRYVVDDAVEVNHLAAKKAARANPEVFAWP